ncbi:hypothetical protein LOC67_10975 [Stieleria sp. JC731]|uniref:hypothetical protein n=1 Tax=Pirellulaceae TaxID=2691357 RepID=UPI001E587C76|nr:hypothetical protein [Stieleria sp. JC731]MCC9601069.1 hypothetical protein [Stieleria sp. JC731]
MKLTLASIRKLFREDFSGEAPILIDRSNLHGAIRHWQAVVDGIEGCNRTKHPGDKDSRSRTLCRFTIPEPESDRSHWRSEEFRLQYDEEWHLTLHSYCGHVGTSQVKTTVSDVDEIKQFVRHVHQRYARQKASAQKREKVRQFKSKAILAQIRKIAKEEGFDFAATQDTVKVKLFVKLASHEMIEMHVPFKQFEKVMPRLKTTIQDLRQLYSEGLRFKMQPVSRLPWDLEWVDHESL